MKAPARVSRFQEEPLMESLNTPSESRGLFLWSLLPLVILASSGVVASRLLPPLSVAQCRLEVQKTRAAVSQEQMAGAVQARLLADDVVRRAFERASKAADEKADLERVAVKLRARVETKPAGQNAVDVSFVSDGSVFSRVLFSELVVGLLDQTAPESPPDVRQQIEESVSQNRKQLETARQELEAFRQQHADAVDQAPARRARLRQVKDDIEKAAEQQRVTEETVAELKAAITGNAADLSLRARLAAAEDRQQQLSRQLIEQQQAVAELQAQLEPVSGLEVSLAQLERKYHDAQYLLEEKLAVAERAQALPRPPRPTDSLPIERVMILEPVTFSERPDVALRVAVIVGPSLVGVIGGLAVLLLGRPSRRRG